jgi:hypothetical protein
MDNTISTKQAIDVAAAPVREANQRTEFSMRLLKKSLDTSQQQADQMLKMLTGLGRHIDIRV